MWTNWIGVAMLAAGGIIGLHAQNDDEQITQDGTRAALAYSMAMYREGVLRYARQSTVTWGELSERVVVYNMPQSNLLVVPGLWRNYIAPNGQVVIYAARLPDVGIKAELAVLSHGSLVAGTANLAGMRIDTATASGPAATLPQFPNVVIPDGVPVWLGWR